MEMQQQVIESEMIEQKARIEKMEKLNQQQENEEEKKNKAVMRKKKLGDNSRMNNDFIDRLKRDLEKVNE